MKDFRLAIFLALVAIALGYPAVTNAQDATPTPSVTFTSCDTGSYLDINAPDGIFRQIETRIQFQQDLQEIYNVLETNPAQYEDAPVQQYDPRQYFNLAPEYSFGLNLQAAELPKALENGFGELVEPLPVSPFRPNMGIIPDIISPLPEIQVPALIPLPTGFAPIVPTPNTGDGIIVDIQVQEQTSGPGVNELDAYLRSRGYEASLSTLDMPQQGIFPLQDLVGTALPPDILEGLFTKLSDADLNFMLGCPNSLSRDYILASHYCAVGDASTCEDYSNRAITKTSDVRTFDALILNLFAVYSDLSFGYRSDQACVDFWGWLDFGTIDDSDVDDEQILFPLTTMRMHYETLTEIGHACAVDVDKATSNMRRFSSLTS